MNLVGWTSLAFLAALFFRCAGEAAGALILRSGSTDTSHLADYLPLGYGAVVGLSSSVVAGAALGTMIGARVYRWQLMLSCGVATVAALLWWFIYEGAFSMHGAVGLGTAAAMIPVSLLAAQRSRRNRIPVLYEAAAIGSRSGIAPHR